MTPRTIHIGASFAIVLVAYWTYALLAVPWIEPPPPPPTGIIGTGRRLAPGEAKELAVLFPARLLGASRRQDHQQQRPGHAALEEYQNHGNGWVDLKPLTVIFMPDENATDTVEACGMPS